MSDLACEGGVPVRSTPFPPWPRLPPECLEASTRVLQSGKVNYWTGEEGRSFEHEFAASVGTKHAIALANGSVAIELALRVLGVQSGDEVVVTPRSFIASASSVVLAGARPVWADIDPRSQNISAESIERVLTPKTKAIIVVHLGGFPARMDQIMRLAESHGISVVEDCAQAQGARLGDRAVGSFGTLSVFSFCQDKIMTTGGEGGMLVTNDARLWEEAWSFKDHGKSYAAMLQSSHPPGFRWVHDSIGTNWRMTEMQSAIGRAALLAVPGWIAERRRNAAELTELLASNKLLSSPEVRDDEHHIFYRYYLNLDLSALKTGWSSTSFAAAVAAEGVPCQIGSCAEIYRERAFQKTEFVPPAPLPNAEQVGGSSIALLVHPGISSGEIADYAAALEKVAAVAAR